MSVENFFTVFPAIDLRAGKVVRLRQGDPEQQTTYFSDPLEVVNTWLDQGVRWMHIINLDGAFDEAGSANLRVIEKISSIACDSGARIQFGGGLRSLDVVRTALEMGISRVILGTAAIENPEIISQAVELFGSATVAVSLDADNGQIRVHGWREGTTIPAITLGSQLYEQGVRWAIFTDISRDGTGRGVNITATAELAESSGLNVIASGGVRSAQDIIAAREAGLPGIIVGRAIYEGNISIQECLQFMSGGELPASGG